MNPVAIQEVAVTMKNIGNKKAGAENLSGDSELSFSLFLDNAVLDNTVQEETEDKEDPSTFIKDVKEGDSEEALTPIQGLMIPYGLYTPVSFANVEETDSINCNFPSNLEFENPILAQPVQGESRVKGYDEAYAVTRVDMGTGIGIGEAEAEGIESDMEAPAAQRTGWDYAESGEMLDRILTDKTPPNRFNDFPAMNDPKQEKSDEPGKRAELSGVSETFEEIQAVEDENRISERIPEHGDFRIKGPSKAEIFSHNDGDSTRKEKITGSGENPLQPLYPGDYPIMQGLDGKESVLTPEGTSAKGSDLSPDAILEQISPQIKSVEKGTPGEMVVHLKPDRLGNVSIKVTTENGKMAVHILTDNIQVQDALRQGMDELKNMLSGSDAELSSLDISCTYGRHDGEAQKFGQQPKPHQQPYRYKDGPVEPRLSVVENTGYRGRFNHSGRIDYII